MADSAADSCSEHSAAVRHLCAPRLLSCSQASRWGWVAARGRTPSGPKMATVVVLGNAAKLSADEFLFWVGVLFWGGVKYAVYTCVCCTRGLCEVYTNECEGHVHPNPHPWQHHPHTHPHTHPPHITPTLMSLLKLLLFFPSFVGLQALHVRHMYTDPLSLPHKM